MKRARGVTLVELVIVIALIGVMASVGVQLMVGPVRSFVQGADRAVLVGTAERAVRRMSEEVRTALPNSLRLATAGGVYWIEFLPVSEAGRLRMSAAAGGVGDPLNVADAMDASFDVFGPLPTLFSDSQLVINNLGTSSGDAWSGNNRRTGLSVDAAGGRLLFSPAGAFPSEPASGRFMLIRGPISYRCEGAVAADGSATGTLKRYEGYAISASQPTDPAAVPLSGARVATLATGVKTCAASYDAAQSILGVVSLNVALAQGDTTVALAWTLPVDNTP